MKFFQSVTTVEELKKEYRKLAKKHHPDVGGDTETMQQINNEYEEMMNRFSNQGMKGANLDDDYRAIIDELIKFDNIDIEIIGTWIWVTGDTYPIRKELGKSGLGFRYSKNKNAWYWHDGEYKARHRKKFTLDEIRGMHDVQTVKTTGKPKMKGLQGA